MTQFAGIGSCCVLAMVFGAVETSHADEQTEPVPVPVAAPTTQPPAMSAFETAHASPEVPVANVVTDPVARPAAISLALGFLVFSPIGELENRAVTSIGGRMALGIAISRRISMVAAIEYISLNKQSFEEASGAFGLLAGGIGIRAISDHAKVRPYVEGTIGPRSLRFVSSETNVVVSAGGVGVSVGLGLVVDVASPVSLSLGATYGGMIGEVNSGAGIAFEGSLRFDI